MKKCQDQPCSKFWALESGSSIHYDAIASPGGRGGGCASRKTLIFCPKFLLQSISSLIKKKIPRNISILPFWPLWRPSFSKFLYLIVLPSPPKAHLLRELNTRCFFSTPGLQLARVPAIRFLQIRSRDPPFHVWACSEAPHLHAWACCGALQFHARLAPKPPFFTLLWHRPTCTTIWAKVPPPPPPPWC